MIGGPPTIGGHPEGPQPAPQRPGTRASQMTAPTTPETSASLRMAGTPVNGRRPKEGLGQAGAAMSEEPSSKNLIPWSLGTWHPASGRDHSRAPLAPEEQICPKRLECTTYNP
jgi:hypothetical protein